MYNKKSKKKKKKFDVVEDQWSGDQAIDFMKLIKYWCCMLMLKMTQLTNLSDRCPTHIAATMYTPGPAKNVSPTWTTLT